MDNRKKHSPAIDAFSGIPIVNICGYSNSGKTTLIESLVSKCIEDGLSTAVMKHFKHEFQLDTSGKDTHRFFNAGATVAGHDSRQFFYRRHAGNIDTVIPDILSLAEDHDLVLVEGHKKISLPVKIWLRRNRHDKPPSDIGPVIADLQTDDNRFSDAFECIRQEVKRQHGKRPLYGGLFTGSLKGGNAASAAATRDAVYTAAGVLQPLAQKIFLLGTDNRFSDYGDFPHIPVFTGVNTLCSATLCAMHCHPHSQWLILDLTDSSGALHSAHRFIDTAQPGVWCVLPENTEDRCHPGMLWIDTRIRRLLETWQNFGNLTCHTKTRRVLL